MVTKKEQLLNEISSRVIAYFSRNKFDSQVNKTDGALSAEDFVAGIFNILYKQSLACKFINVNKIPNYPGIDLLDKNLSIAVQVTVENRLDKIKKTFDTIPASKDNDEYKTIWFFVQHMTLTSGQKKFASEYEGYKVRIFGVTELLKEVLLIDDLSVLQEMHLYVKTMLVFPDVDIETVNIDSAVFELLFNVLKDKSEASNPASDIVYHTSPREKKEKYAKDWSLLEALYKESLGVSNGEIDLHRLKNYRSLIEEVFSEELDEVQKEQIQSYLRTQSLLVLHQNNGDPVNAVDKLCTHLRDDLRIGFVPKNQLLSFCLNMFFTCDVFPLIISKNEQD